MSTHFVVESDRAIVGVAIRVPGGFRFFQSDPRFQALDGKIFRRARMLASAVRDFGRQFSRDHDR